MVWLQSWGFEECWVLCHRTNVLCCKERSPQKKNYSKIRKENIAVVFIQLWSLQLEKFLLLPSSRWWRGVCESWLFDTRLSQQIGRSRLGYDGLGPPEPLTHPFWQLPSTLPRPHYTFSYIEILENKSKIRECSMSRETRDITSVIILKSRLTLQVSWHLHWLTTAPVRNITQPFWTHE